MHESNDARLREMRRELLAWLLMNKTSNTLDVWQDAHYREMSSPLWTEWVHKPCSAAGWIDGTKLYWSVTPAGLKFLEDENDGH